MTQKEYIKVIPQLIIKDEKDQFISKVLEQAINFQSEWNILDVRNKHRYNYFK